MGKIAQLRLKVLAQDMIRLAKVEEEEMRLLLTDYSRKNLKTVDGISEIDGKEPKGKKAEKE